MALTVYNTHTREKEPFVPVDPNRITMYVCGPTVYNRVHIGNARPPVVFDTLYRVLKQLYPNVVYARNITDIDDKIIKTSQETGEDIGAITSRYAAAYAEDMAQMGCLTPDVIPHATDHINEMIAMVETLIAKGHAYESDAHVLFAVESMEKYGSLSNRVLDDMLAGARVEVADYKRHPGDFVLWKPSNSQEPGWDSPWGRGRPGWHLECSAMIEKHLGKTIDIHGGGRDLIFPHHENELAQSCCAHDGEQYVKYWMHNGYINIDGEKMSKSLGNFRMVNNLLEEWDGEVLRLALLGSHYRSDANFSQSTLEAAKQTLDSWYLAISKLPEVERVAVNINETKWFKALCDDLNTPIAIAEMHGLVKAAATGDVTAISEMYAAAEMLGLLQRDAGVWLKGEGDDDAEIDALVAERVQAKADKNWGRADEIRTELAAQGIIIEDSKSGSTWRRA